MWQGLRAFLAGMHRLFAEPALRAVVWRMSGVLLALMLILAGASAWLSATLIGQFVPEGDAWYIGLLDVLVWLFAVAMGIAVGILSYMTLGSVIAAAWLEQLVAHVEGGSGSSEAVASWRRIVQSLGNAVMPLLQFLPYAVLSLVLLLVPVIGSALAMVTWTYAGIRLLAYEVMDALASRHGWDWSRRKLEFERHRGFYLGLCTAAAAVMMVPLLNLLVLPAAVVGLAQWYWLKGE